MKKFWALIAIIVLVLTTWTVHYMQFAQAKHDQPVATFKALTGEQDILQSVVLDGSFDNMWSYSPFSIQDGAIYPVATSVFTRDNSALFQYLEEKYKGFMRGKTLSASQFYEQQDSLLYVESFTNHGDTETELRIEQLHDGEAHAFSVNVPLDNRASWTTTQRLTVQNDILHVLLSVMYADSVERLYGVKIDLRTEAVTSATVLAEALETEKTSGFIQVLNNTSAMQHEDYFVYMTGEYYHNDMDMTPNTNEEIHVWNTLTNTQASFTLPETLVRESRSLMVQNNQLLALRIEKGNIVMERYNLDTQQWMKPITVDNNAAINNLSYFSVNTTAQDVYVAAYTEKGPMLTVLNGETGETLYIGIAQGDEAERLLLSLYSVFETK